MIRAILCSACLFIFKEITYTNEPRQSGVSPRSPTRRLLTADSDERLQQRDALPGDSCGDSCRGSFIMRERTKIKVQNEAEINHNA